MQLAVAFWIGLSTTHNHFVWYSGGDATEYWTASWSFAHGHIGDAGLSYGVPVLWAWVPLVTGTTLIVGLPVIVLIQLLVLVPLAVVLVWAIGDLLFGRLFAWWATALWIVGPILMLSGFDGTYASEFKSLFLAPHWFGLTNMADFPSLVAVLATTWATLRLVERRTVEDAVLSGLLAGTAIAFKPANGFFLPAVALLLFAVRDVRHVLAWGAAFAPALVTLAVWKDKGLGELPLFASAGAHEALASRPVVAVTNRYVHFDWSHFHQELHDLSEVFWSVRLLEVLAIIGLVGALRRSPLKGAFLGLWFAGFCIVKGSSDLSEVTSTSYFRFVEPGLPAFVFLAASTVFLVPRRGRQFDRAHVPGRLSGGRPTIGAAVALLAAIPLLVVLVASPASPAVYARSDALANESPISARLAVSARVEKSSVRLTWHSSQSGPTRIYYVVYESSLGPGCVSPSPEGAECLLSMNPVGMTRDTTFVDHPRGGRHWYRIAMIANDTNTMTGSDMMLIGPATRVAEGSR